MRGGLRLSVRSLALVVIPSYWRATSRGCHTRHRADLCNFVCLCSCFEKRNYSPLIEDEVPAFVSLKKLQFKNKPSCRDHCITARPRRLLFRTRARGGGGGSKAQSWDTADPGRIPGPGGTGDKVCREAAADVRTRGCTGAPEFAACRARPAAAVAAFSSAGGGPLPPFSPQAGALAELRRAPGVAFLLRHLLLLLLPQWQLHLPQLAASVPAPGLVSCPRLVPRSRSRPEHRALRRPPPVREAAAAGSREACELNEAGRGSERQRPGLAG